MGLCDFGPGWRLFGCMRMNTPCHSVALVALLTLITACADMDTPTSPTATPPMSPPQPVSPVESPRAFPPVSRPARIYVGVEAQLNPMHGSPLASRYVLYGDGTFALQYSSANFFEYRGTYEEINAVVAFYWDACCGWGATGLLSNDALSVHYNERMEYSDFLNGVYIRAQ